MTNNQISQELYDKLKELYETSSNKSTLPHPDEIKGHPFFIMIEMLQKVTDTLAKSDEESNALFSEYYSVCLRGINPFKDSLLKKAGVEGKAWKSLLKSINGVY